MTHWQAAVVVLAATAAFSAQAQLFPDNEARKAILELRATDEAQARQLAEIVAAHKAANKELLDQIQLLRRSLLDLNNQIEAVRVDMARQRGSDEQLARSVSELARSVSEVQQRQKDIAQGVDDRIRKLEPVKASVDGKEFLVDPDEKRQYDEAFALIRGGDFTAAATALTNFGRRYPASGYADAARFWLGNAQYGKREYKEAVATFRGFLATAPEHPRAPEALLALANCQAEMKDGKSARATLTELVKKYPQSEAAQAGKERLAALK